MAVADAVVAMTEARAKMTETAHPLAKSSKPNWVLPMRRKPTWRTCQRGNNPSPLTQATCPRNAMSKILPVRNALATAMAVSVAHARIVQIAKIVPICGNPGR